MKVLTFSTRSFFAELCFEISERYNAVQLLHGEAGREKKDYFSHHCITGGNTNIKKTLSYADASQELTRTFQNAGT